MIQVAVLGYGTVGSGVIEVIKTNQELINQKSGCEIKVKYVLDLREFPGDPVQDILVHDYKTILEDSEVAIVCEAMGGEHPAYEFSKQALEAGKSVCTSNKEVVEKHGAELIQIAKEHNCNYMFEASVGGGIPIIRPMNTSLAQEHITSITGILNGTTNYILTKMEKEGSDFSEVLKEAQDMGYAERNPEADIEGHDAARKIAILSSLAFGRNVNIEDIYTEGITKISTTDFKYAKLMGATIKLFGSSMEKNGRYYACVAPFMVFPTNPLFAVSDVFNGILVHGNTLDDTMYYGRGAGKLPTASAIVSDVIDCAKHVGKHVVVYWQPEKLALSNMDEVERRFFVRVAAMDRSEIAKVFGKVNFIDANIEGECGFVTDLMTEKQFKDCEAASGQIISRIRLS